ncbi:hypothetical protein jhhlp_008696 [Lomentospora prolificans]|uniref:Probable methionine--tRNA ligase, mitochondrial n=1 Tax=Lomentospora prolificans TaxID=41688 RepID=A0A2N3MYS3_9PEZI|nr:hypothetical protein jhhlp_008696 [Lomentospora prolificans]
MQLLRLPARCRIPSRAPQIRSLPSRPPGAFACHGFLQRRLQSSAASLTEKPFYVTTPIFYVNASPHIGHAHSMVLADVFKRWATLQGRRATLCTGTDEHGMKIQRAAAKAGQAPKDFCDTYAQKFREIAESLTLSEHDFIRTTDAQHVAAVQQFWKELNDRDLIYETTHKGWYSVSDECFYPESMIERSFVPETGKVIWSAIESGSEVEWVEEKNYHFRMTAFREQLLDFYRANPNWITPEYKMKEVVSWVENHLEDLSISRPANRLSWGIPVPDDPSQTVYVWVDALINYISNLGYPNWTPEIMMEKGWPADVHIIGKDILRFHGVYWPALLLAVGLPLPKNMLTHAHWTIGGRKISKSAGNGVSPIFAVDRFGADTIRFFLMRKGAIRDDSIFENGEVAKVYRTDLMGTFGNLLARTTRTVKWSVVSAVRDETTKGDTGKVCPLGLETLRDKVAVEMKALRPDRALALIMDTLTEANKYMSSTAPWTLSDVKHENKEAFAQLSYVVYTLAESLRISAILLQPYMPERAREALDRLGVAPEKRDFAHAVRGADNAYGMSFMPRGFEGKGAEKSLFPPLGKEFPEEDGEPLVEDRKARKEEREMKRAAKLKAKAESRERAKAAAKQAEGENEDFVLYHLDVERLVTLACDDGDGSSSRAAKGAEINIAVTRASCSGFNVTRTSLARPPTLDASNFAISTYIDTILILEKSMKFNEHIAVSTSRVLLVPYEAHHVPRYHTWMKDAEIQELTASEPLSLEEEYENQISWRESADKLTFIVCLPRDAGDSGERVEAGRDDAEGRMVGDVNFFLYPDNDDEDAEKAGHAGETKVFGEIDIMIAEKSRRGQGLGRGALKAMLAFIRKNLRSILAEYAGSCGAEGKPRLTKVVAKIKEKNVTSRGLFGSLGFVEVGGVNYFGEVEMVVEGFAGKSWDLEEEARYREMEYRMAA